MEWYEVVSFLRRAAFLERGAWPDIAEGNPTQRCACRRPNGCETLDQATPESENVDSPDGPVPLRVLL